VKRAKSQYIAIMWVGVPINMGTEERYRFRLIDRPPHSGNRELELVSFTATGNFCCTSAQLGKNTGLSKMALD
jgi:hypothetical protein